jgi:protocatechuate 3,4-dioxygenase beta subunit
VAGTVSGRVGMVHRGVRIVLQRRAGGKWHFLAWARTSRHGRFSFGSLHPGAYRVVWRGETGPVVRV